MTDEKMKRNLRSQALLRRERERRHAAYMMARRVFFSLCAVLAVAAVLCWRNQTIQILDEETFEYTTFLGNKKVYSFSEIRSVRKNSDSATLFVGDGKVHIEAMAIMSDRLTEKLDNALKKQ